MAVARQPETPARRAAAGRHVPAEPVAMHPGSLSLREPGGPHVSALADNLARDERTPEGGLRRCTFRRLDPVRVAAGGPAAYYMVTCLYAGQADALLLGDLTSARSICGACRMPGVFRPDEH